MDKAIVSWSGGKDSALALYHARKQFDVVGLVTTVTAGINRVSMHGVRNKLIEAQAHALGLPLFLVEVSQNSSNEEYEERMCFMLDVISEAGVSHAICGDLFLEDIRRYREQRLFREAMQGVFPLWQRSTRELAQELIELDFRAVLCCVDTSRLDAGFAGREYDAQLLRDLPPEVDPCGENGEFHTFLYDAPLFKQPIPWGLGQRVLKNERFMFVDLVPRRSRRK